MSLPRSIPAARRTAVIFAVHAMTATTAVAPAAFTAAWAQPAAPSPGKQGAAADAPSPHRPARGPFIRSHDLVVLGALLAAAGATAPADTRIARWSQRPALHANSALNDLMSGARTLGGAGTVVLPLATYGIGLIARDRDVARVGLETGAGVVAASAVTALVKDVAGRARPYVSHDRDAGDFGFGRGLSRGDAYQSFPSGHATASFALAAALDAEGRVHWPAVHRFAAPLGYVAAAVVAASRVYHDAHWASDVLVGAGVGTLAGGAIARFALARPDAPLEGRLLPTAARGGAPVALAWRVGF